MPLITRAFPLHRPVEELRAFAAALCGERSPDTTQFYRRYGVSHESWHVQETPTGPWVIAVTVIDNPEEAAPRPRSWDRPLYDFRGGLSGAGASSTDSKMAANIERGF